MHTADTVQSLQLEIKAKLAPLEKFKTAVTVSDPGADDCPLIYVNQAFCDLTRGKSYYFEGKNCRMLQGPDTNKGAVARLRRGIAERRSVTVCLRNYRFTGEPFDNLVVMAPFKSRKGYELFLGCQYELNASMRGVFEHVSATDTVLANLSPERSTAVKMMLETYQQRCDSVKSLVGAYLSRPF